uniref:Uncharacterized protein n=1 Tax=Cacopsylla melanoneura TaxID=428564 RepID=A0A8D8QY03_9HEMI
MVGIYVRGTYNIHLSEIHVSVGIKCVLIFFLNNFLYSIRLMTGHESTTVLMNIYIEYIVDTYSPICPLCNLQAIMNAEHLSLCPDLTDNNNLVGKYWDARRKMT